MQKMKECLGSKKGEMYIRAAVIIVILCMIFSLLLNYTMTTELVKGQRKGAIQVLDQYTQRNAIDIYNSIKQCNDDTQSLDPSAFITSLCMAQGLQTSDTMYISYAKDRTKRYQVSDVSMSFYVEHTTKIQVSYTLSVPLKFMGRTIWVDVPVTITTSLNPKFDMA